MKTTNQTLTLQQQRFCDEYLVSFNAYRAALNAGYSENTARKAELLHLPKVQAYLKRVMNKTADRLQITHDMILRELAKVAFANMGNYYNEHGVLKPMTELTPDEKAAINQYQVLDATDDDGRHIGELSRIKLHNKMSALDKIARHLNFYGVAERRADVGGMMSEEEDMEDVGGKMEDVGMMEMEDVKGNMEDVGVTVDERYSQPLQGGNGTGLLVLGGDDVGESVVDGEATNVGINTTGSSVTEDPADALIKILTLSPLLKASQEAGVKNQEVESRAIPKPCHFERGTRRNLLQAIG